MISRKYDGSAQHDEGDQQDQGRRNMAGGSEHDRGKPCHYYIRNGYVVALDYVFHHAGIPGRARSRGNRTGARRAA